MLPRQHPDRIRIAFDAADETCSGKTPVTGGIVVSST